MRLFQSIADELRMQRGVLILSHMSKEDLLRELREHEEILDRIKRRDGEGAAELLTTHLRTAIRILSEARSRKGQGQAAGAGKKF
jgi:DNA-binding GntR family transcriptional regulator